MYQYRSHVKSNQLIALEEIINLTMKDPRIREILAHFPLNRFITYYREPDLLCSTVKALGAVEFSNVHCLWARVISVRSSSSAKDYLGLPEHFKRDIFETLRYFRPQLTAIRALTTGTTFFLLEIQRHLFFRLDISSVPSKYSNLLMLNYHLKAYCPSLGTSTQASQVETLPA